MNFTYFKFLFINTIKRKPVWITWLLFVFTCICFIIILPLAAKMNTLQVWANTTMTICQTFLGMTAALFTAVLAINMFKDTNEEGTELIVVSKPISRFQIVFTKFILFAVFCLAVNLSAVIISLFTIFLPRTETRFYWGLVLSMFIGNLITFGVFGSIAILMSVNVAKVGIIITNIALSLVFLIYQALTVFVFPIPAKALVDNRMAAPSYITTSRNFDTGDYVEQEFVKFTGTPVDKKKHPCQAKNWQDMKNFWTNQILAVDPSNALIATDLASQISLTYLSYGIDDYAYRQASRMFAASRFYDYELLSPVSPEIINVENKETLPWIYSTKTTISFEISQTQKYKISIPGRVGFFAIKPITTTRLKGYAKKIPIGYIKTKELLSEREVFFEPDQWKKYKTPFKMIYDKIFDWHHYVDVVFPETFTDYTEFAALFEKNTDAEQIYYDLIWNCLTGGDKSLLKDDITHELLYDKTSFDISSVDDLNDRFMQFKYFAYAQALQEQQKLIMNDPTDPDIYNSWLKAKEDLTDICSALLINYTPGWMAQANSKYCVAIEPGTRTVGFNLIDNAFDHEWEDVISKLSTEEEKRNKSCLSPKGIMQRTMSIFNTIANPTEKFLFDSLEKPTRNAQATGDIHTTTEDWIPYVLTMLAPDYDPETMPEKTSSMPIGHNMTMFYYKVTPKLNYWYFAILWGIISLMLLAGGVVVYNKYDVK